MKILRASWLFGRWCAGCLRDFLLTLLWLALAVLLFVQITIITSHRIPMPGWVLRQIEDRLEIRGMQLQIGDATMDPAGHVLIHDLKIIPPAYDDAIASVKSIYVRLDPLALFHGRVKPLYIHVNGLDLLLPAMVSPTGKTETVVNDIRFSARNRGRTLAIDDVSGRLANLTFAARGALTLPADLDAPQSSSSSQAEVDAFLRSYTKTAREIVNRSPQLSVFDQPHLAVDFAGLKDALSLGLVFTADSASLDLNETAGRVRLGRLRASTHVDLGTALPEILDVFVRCRTVESDRGLRLDGLSSRLTVKPDPSSPSLLRLAATARSASFKNHTLNAPLLALIRTDAGSWQVDLTAETLGSLWHLAATANPATGSGHGEIEGFLTNEVVREISGFTGRPPERLLVLRDPAPIQAAADFSDGWKCTAAQGRFQLGPVVASSVPFDRIGGEFSFDGSNLLFHHLSARKGENSAQGIYWMNTKTRDFRFLLTGSLRPLDIADFFDDWWPHFWHNFDFTRGLPRADVDVSGRWGSPTLSTVFVNIDVLHPVIRDVALDHVNTTLFIRPDYYNALEVRIARDDHIARGSFVRAVDYYKDTDDLKYIDFDFVTNLDVAETARLFGSEGIETVEPFVFANPPSARIVGHVDGPASPRGRHRLVEIALKSSGDFYLYHFPLRDLTFHGTIRDDEIDLPSIQVSFAQGQATGSANIAGPDNARQLRFDCKLTDALLGDAIGTLERYSASERGESAPEQSRFQQKVADGRLNLKLAAQGLFNDLYSFYGHGNMELTGAQLAQINLLGALSQLLSKVPAFQFTTLELNEAKTSFVLERDRLSLPDLKITGKSTLIEAKGSYLLNQKSMEFDARVYPFKQGKTLLANAVDLVLLPISNALELKLSGSIDKPNWRLAYGPTSFLYNLTGGRPSDTTEPEDKSKPRPLATPYLRH